MFNRAWLHESIHMQLAALQAVGFAVGGIHAALYLRNRTKDLNLKAVKIAMVFGAAASLAQPFAGHFAGQSIAELQPAKLAAMESHFATSRHAPVYLGGIPNMEKQTVEWGIAIPGLLSLLAHNELNAEVKGLDQFPRENWPPVLVCHVAFQVMVAIGTAMAMLGGGVFFWFLSRGDFPGGFCGCSCCSSRWARWQSRRAGS